MTVIKVDGSELPVQGELTLQAMQELVGGYIEVVTIGGTATARELLIVDEDGLLKRKSVNARATALYRGTPPRHDGIIVGDAIQCVCLDGGTDLERYR